MRHIRLAFYSAAHFWVDLSCALLLLGAVCPEADPVRCILLYNFSAFAVQMPIGLLADRLNRNHQVAAAGCGLVAAAWFLTKGAEAAVLAGVGNALFHVGGGLDTMNRSGEKAGPLGVFVSPGGAFPRGCGQGCGRGACTASMRRLGRRGCAHPPMVPGAGEPTGSPAGGEGKMAPSAAMPAAGGGAALLERLSVSLPLERGARGAVDMRRGTGKDGGRTGGGPIWDQPDGSDHTGTLGALFSGVRLGADRAFGRVSLPNDDASHSVGGGPAAAQRQRAGVWSAYLWAFSGGAAHASGLGADKARSGGLCRHGPPISATAVLWAMYGPEKKVRICWGFCLLPWRLPCSWRRQRLPYGGSGGRICSWG